MNPNEYQPPQQQPDVPPQPQQPTAPVGQPQIMQPQVGPYGPQLNIQPTQPVYNQPQPMYGQNSMPSSGSKGKMFAIIGGVVVLIVVVVLAVVLLGHKSNNPSGSSSGGTSNSSGVSASSATTSKTACQLFTLSDAQAAIGSDASQVPPQVAQTKNNNTQSLCIYSSNSNSLTIVVEVAQNSAGSSSQESDFSKALSVSGTVSVSGLGDKALYGQPTYGGEEIEVIKGSVLFAISANSGSQATLIPMAKTILSNF